METILKWTDVNTPGNFPYIGESVRDILICVFTFIVFILNLWHYA